MKPRDDVACGAVRLARILATLIAVLATMAGVPPASADDQSSKGDAETAEAREALFAAARGRAEATKVLLIAGNEQVESDLVEKPLFRYSDQPRGILDGTLWAWEVGGLPVALQKIEVYRRPDNVPNRLYCLTSLSPELIRVEWSGRRRYEAKAPGIRWQRLATGPTPADSDSGRLLQMKGLARQFSARLADPGQGWQEQMRLLTTPLHRFSSPKRGVIDGAILGFSTNGTNPDSVLLIQLRQDDSGEAHWEYALARVTSCEVTARLDGRQVWSVSHVKPPPADYDNWLYFWESASTDQ